MTIARGCTLLAAFAVIALSVVHLRAEQTRCAARVLRIESDWMRFRGDLWSLQTRIARMRAPDRIHDRATYLATGLVPPGVRGIPPGGPPGRIERLVANVPARTRRASEHGSAKPQLRRR
ncbi:MAG: hypothetical protein Q7R41_05785, partial [Phycisphaerales bacterium]|nr:hypothetical protein [Phycisphaerales bacterium]